MYGENVGSSILNIKDSAGKAVSVSVNIKEILKNLVVTGFNTSRNGVEGEIINFTTTSGNGNYTIFSSNTNIASVSINSTIGNGSITLRTPGSATITIKDGKGKSMSMNIGVLPILKNIEYTPQVEDGYLGGMYYEVENNNLIKETGIEYKYLDSSNKVTKQGIQIIPKNTDTNDRSYAAFIVPNCNSTCVIEVRAYVKTINNPTIYKNNGAWGKINYGVKILTSTSTLKVANNGEENVFSGETDDIQEEEEYIEDDTSGYEESVHNENSGESIESEYSEEKEETYEEENSEDEEGVEVNAVGQILTVGIFLAGVGLTGYTCVQDGWLSTSCIVSAGLTVVPVGKVLNWTGKVIPKNMVLNYISSTAVGKLATTLGKFVDDVANLGKWAKLIKPIKSIDLKHISLRHAYGTIPDASKFLKGSNIESIIKEGYIKSGRKFLETTSIDINTGKNIKTILIEVNIGRQIGVTNNGKVANFLRTIVDYNGNIISSYPIDKFSF